MWARVCNIFENKNGTLSFFLSHCEGQSPEAISSIIGEYEIATPLLKARARNDS